MIKRVPGESNCNSQHVLYGIKVTCPDNSTLLSKNNRIKASEMGLNK